MFDLGDAGLGHAEGRGQLCLGHSGRGAHLGQLVPAHVCFPALAGCGLAGGLLFAGSRVTGATFGLDVTPLGVAEPGSVKGVQLVVEDLNAVRSELAGRGVGISDVQQMGPEGTPGSRYCFFEDPDGNMWAIQEYKRT